MSKYTFNQRYPLSSRNQKRLNKEYGEGNWNFKGGKGYAASGTVPIYRKGWGGYRDVTVYHKLPKPKAADPAPAPAPAPVPQAQPPMAPIPLPVNQPQQTAFNPMDMLPMLMAAMAPPPPQPIPEPVTYASAGQAAQSVPGVKIKKSPARISRQNTLGTRGAFNRNDLRISNLNI